MRSIRDSAANGSPRAGDGIASSEDNAGPPKVTPPSISRLLTRGRVATAVGLAVLVLTGLALFGDIRDLVAALRTFDWRLAPPILALTVWNYAWRFVKWEMYLRRLAVRPLSLRTSGLVFLSGFSMSLTPGKVGELVKSIYLRRLTGAPVNRTSAIIAAERVTDAIAMLALAAIGLFQFDYARPFVLVLATVIAVILLALQRPTILTGIVRRMDDWPAVGRVAHHALAFLDASGILYRPRILSRAIALGIVSWSGECVAFFLVLRGLGLDTSWHLLLVATFVLAVSSLAGGASMLPGGLGVAEASIAGMLLLLVDDEMMSRTVAAAATILIRFATLWLAVLLGAMAVIILERTTHRATGTVQSPSPWDVPPAEGWLTNAPEPESRRRRRM